jgi:hypothetical protein
LKRQQKDDQDKLEQLEKLRQELFSEIEQQKDEIAERHKSTLETIKTIPFSGGGYADYSKKMSGMSLPSGLRGARSPQGSPRVGSPHPPPDNDLGSSKFE